MLKTLLIILIIVIGSFLLFAPFWHVGGNYYRGLLLIYDVRYESGNGWLPAPDFMREVTLLRWADPTSFEYVEGSYAKDRFSVYLTSEKLEGFDSNTFKAVQAPHTNEFYFHDSTNLRMQGVLVLKRVSGEGRSLILEKFDMESFEPLGFFIIKDKNGIYLYLHSADFTDENDSRIELFEKVKNVDSETFKIGVCDQNYCYASDKNNYYQIRICRQFFCKTEFSTVTSKQ